MTYANISEARACLTGRVLIWHQHRLGGNPKDRHLWTAEQAGQVLDYGNKESLIKDYPDAVVLTLHRNGSVSTV